MNVIYLEDLLAERSFREATNRLCGDVRDARDLPPVYQIGALVPDVERAASALEDRGIGPFFIMAGSAAAWRERGEQRDCTLKLGLAFHEGIQVELIEPVEGSDIHRDGLDLEGKPVVQHLAFLVNDVDAWAQKLQAAGTGLWVRATLKGPGLTADLAYMERNEEDGLSVEFIHTKVLGLPLALPGGIVHALGRLQKTTGKRCLEV
jgi:hypothetical protein